MCMCVYTQMSAVWVYVCTCCVYICAQLGVLLYIHIAVHIYVCVYLTETNVLLIISLHGIL